MNIFSFERNFYLETFQDTQQFDNDRELFDFVEANPNFHYSNAANYEDFSKKYTADGWLGRKILAIPAGAYHAIVETTVAIAIGLIVAPYVALQGELRIHSKYIFFYSVRHIQISFGHLATLVNDQYGLYHIQEGYFYLTCYRCWRKSRMIFVKNGHGVIV